MLSPCIAYVMPTNLNRSFTDLSSNSVLGRPTPNALGTAGKEQPSRKSGDSVFNFWLKVRGYLLWHGLVSQLNLIRKVVASKM